jgi:hypothetical protein
MTSAAGIASALLMLLTIPAAIASQALGEWGPGVVVHLTLGASTVALAIAMFDFDVPRWINRIGAASAAALGAIFLLQAASLILDNALDGIAFKVLGQVPEGVLPLVILAWFAALLLTASRDRTRIIGWVVVPASIVLTVAMLVGVYVGADVAYLKIAMILPFAWLLLESAKSPARTSGRAPRISDLAARPAS